MELCAKNNEVSDELILIRIQQTAYQTIGGFMIFDKDNNCVFKGKTLELPFLENRQQISAIPAETYACIKTKHHHFGNCFQVLNVENRIGIYGHVGNYHSQIRGCILFGDALKDINADGIVDVTNSRKTLDKMLDLLTEKFNLVIL